MPRWEYKLVLLTSGFAIRQKKVDETVNRQIAELGEQGWEAVGIAPFASGTLSSVYVLFKRPLSD